MAVALLFPDRVFVTGPKMPSIWLQLRARQTRRYCARLILGPVTARRLPGERSWPSPIVDSGSLGLLIQADHARDVEQSL